MSRHSSIELFYTYLSIYLFVICFNATNYLLLLVCYWGNLTLYNFIKQLPSVFLKMSDVTVSHQSVTTQQRAHTKRSPISYTLLQPRSVRYIGCGQLVLVFFAFTKETMGKKQTVSSLPMFPRGSDLMRIPCRHRVFWSLPLKYRWKDKMCKIKSMKTSKKNLPVLQITTRLAARHLRHHPPSATKPSNTFCSSSACGTCA